ncbi:probable serine/threonine-protein kinase clkA [Oppia nitens]|uniref:probable serine/threonine-protein kinase clkA n=1 Tax=Oppia nitens TaxID=1686743 RepID=UPI0023DA717A|nr:probable serine/threonine-protein kinase clkA [Oppia nitens]
MVYKPGGGGGLAYQYSSRNNNNNNSVKQYNSAVYDGNNNDDEYSASSSSSSNSNHVNNNRHQLMAISYRDNDEPKSLSYQSDYNETPMPYQFHYDIDDGYGNKQDRHEKADVYGNVIGSYGYWDSNGIYRKVDYTADADGFKANVNSNEPYLRHGVNPADVRLVVEEQPIPGVLRQSSSTATGANGDGSGGYDRNLNYRRNDGVVVVDDAVVDNNQNRYEKLLSNQIRDVIYMRAPVDTITTSAAATARLQATGDHESNAK